MNWDEYERKLESDVTSEPMRTVRHDCSFCGRERSAKDDNHAPDCVFWLVFPSGDRNNPRGSSE